MIQKFMRTCAEDNNILPLNFFADLFARGLTTFLDSRYQNFKYQFWDSRKYFKPTYDFDDTAIVIQGPLVYENNYTAETFKLYRSIYPNAPIILSTWKNEATDAFRKECKNNAVVLLENEMPDPPGAWHINCQLKSSFLGVKYVQENTSAKFVLKTRADQRIIQNDFLLYFKNLVVTFPPFGNKLQGRILTFDHCKWIPFHLSDLISFGYLSDILKLYSADYSLGSNVLDYCRKREGHFWKVINLVTRYASRYKLDENLLTENRRRKKFNSIMSRWVSPEIYIMKTFHEKYIAPIDKTKLLETAFKFIHDYILIIGNRPGMLDWPKYENQRYNSGDYYAIDEVNVSFSRWLDMYRNFKIDWV